jgi:hypothetical protein
MVEYTGNPPGEAKLLYSVPAAQFVAGTFAQFQVSVSAPGIATPVSVSLQQIGGAQVLLVPIAANLSVQSSHPSVSMVTIMVPNGTVPWTSTEPIVANLRIAASDNSIVTATNVQVKILVLQGKACLEVAHFITDAEFGVLVPPLTISPQKGDATLVQSTAPGSFSDNVVAVNRCPSTVTFDLKFILDAAFVVSPNNGQGNAVLTYVTSNTFDQQNLNLAIFGTGTGHRNDLCLTNIALQPGYTFLARVHSDLPKGSKMPVSPLVFTAERSQANSFCSTPVLETVVATVPFTLKTSAAAAGR